MGEHNRRMPSKFSVSKCGFGKILSAMFVPTTLLEVLEEGKADKNSEQAGRDWEKRFG